MLSLTSRCNALFLKLRRDAAAATTPAAATSADSAAAATAALAAIAHGKMRKAAEDSCDPMRPLPALRPFA